MIRLSHALELVFALAAGMAFARYRATCPEFPEYYPTRFGRIQDGVDSVFTGVALVEAFGVAVERARGKSPRPWGWGRWVWCLAGAYIVVAALDHVADLAASRALATYIQNSFTEDLVEAIRGGWGAFLLPTLAQFLLAGCAVMLIAPHVKETKVDDRELSGRAFAALTVALMLTFKVLMCLGYSGGGMGGSSA
jgi:hypothetical protein